MPCVELADAIVQTARETLENAIRVVEDTKEWNAKVVYLFNLFPYLFLFLFSPSFI